MNEATPTGTSPRRQAYRAPALIALAIAAAAVVSTASKATPSHVATDAATVKTTVNVTVGAPTELSVKLSKSSSIPAGSVSFRVTNGGLVKHVFKVCLTAAPATLPNACTGKAVTLAKSGQSATLTLTLKTGKYEFLSTATGQAVPGRKGLVGIGLKVPAATQPIPAAGGTTTPPKSGGGGTVVTTPPTTTPPKSGGGTGTTLPNFPAGNASNGAAIFGSAGCGSCHALQAAGTVGGGGPDLNALKPPLADVLMQVYVGGDPMPSFAGTLSNQQIADVAAYVVASTR